MHFSPMPRHVLHHHFNHFYEKKVANVVGVGSNTTLIVIPGDLNVSEMDQDSNVMTEEYY